MGRPDKIIFFHTGGAVLPPNLDKGEIGVTSDDNAPHLYVTKNDGSTAVFVDLEYINDTLGNISDRISAIEGGD